MKSSNIFVYFFFSQEKKSMIHKVHTSNDLKREYQMLRGK